MRSLQMDSIIVSGHTDYRGDQQYNKELSWRRANSVAAYLQKHFSALTISKGYGSEQPVADNRTAQGRLMNRRVEIFFYIRQ
jgi:OOP family OmpA-OmpF porin